MSKKEKYIQRFKELYRQKNNKDISDAEAQESFEKLVVLVRAIYKPIPLKIEQLNK